MADPHIISKVHELRAAIISHEERLERDRNELAVMTAALAMFERGGDLPGEGRPAAIRNLFKRGEVLALCKVALADQPDGMTTRDLGIACLAAREFDYKDAVLLRAMVGLLSNTLKKALRRGDVAKVGQDSRKASWRLPKRQGCFSVFEARSPAAVASVSHI